MKIKDKFNICGHKLNYHQDRVNVWLKGERIAPIYIEIGITSNCNIACIYCEYGTHQRKKKISIPSDILIRFLRDAKLIGVKGVGFFGDGEPMLHPEVYEAIEAGKRAGLDMGISTNGLCLQENKLKNLLKNLVLIRFNVSGASAQTYSRVMGTTEKNFDKVVKNIRKCVDIKRRYHLNVTIGIQMVLTKESIGEIVLFSELGLSLGVDYASIKQCTPSHLSVTFLRLSLLAQIRSICTAKFQSIFHIPNLHCGSHLDILWPQISFD